MSHLVPFPYISLELTTFPALWTANVPELELELPCPEMR